MEYLSVQTLRKIQPLCDRQLGVNDEDEVDEVDTIWSTPTARGLSGAGTSLPEPAMMSWCLSRTAWARVGTHNHTWHITDTTHTIKRTFTHETTHEHNLTFDTAQVGVCGNNTARIGGSDRTST
mmetsp:Transcript_65171/g.142097  ORF Transcript_65171/g.142097 Transcript_65171/m.142097 type:complete len:124 (-) Transcript_65171:174-545(-)